MWRSENRIESLTSHERLHSRRATKLLELPGNSITAKLLALKKYLATLIENQNTEISLSLSHFLDAFMMLTKLRKSFLSLAKRRKY